MHGIYLYFLSCIIIINSKHNQKLETELMNTCIHTILTFETQLLTLNQNTTHLIQKIR